MGKIESGEIGEVDPLPDSGNSLALIRYARRAVSSRSPQHAERGGSLREEDRGKPICSSVCPAPSSGHPQGISGDFVLFCFVLHCYLFSWYLCRQKERVQKAIPSGNCISRYKWMGKSCEIVCDSENWFGMTISYFRDINELFFPSYSRGKLLEEMKKGHVKFFSLQFCIWLWLWRLAVALWFHEAEMHETSWCFASKMSRFKFKLLEEQQSFLFFILFFKLWLNAVPQFLKTKCKVNLLV